MTRVIGQCKQCKYWDKNGESFLLERIKLRHAKVTKSDMIDCKKNIFTPVDGKWGCWFWREK